MISAKIFTELASSFPGVTQRPHFEKTAFHSGKKIFATLSQDGTMACVKLSEIDQSVFCIDKETIFPVPNNWGKQGWTNIILAKVKKSVLIDALNTAYTAALHTK